jgi:hypothetical protein
LEIVVIKVDLNWLLFLENMGVLKIKCIRLREFFDNVSFLGVVDFV